MRTRRYLRPSNKLERVEGSGDFGGRCLMEVFEDNRYKL